MRGHGGKRTARALACRDVDNPLAPSAWLGSNRVCERRPGELVRVVAPREPNGYKLERFILDLPPEARGAVRVEALREDEYAPVKNADGNESPATARLALAACLELDPALIDGPEEAAGRPVRDARAAGPGVRSGAGGSA